MSSLNELIQMIKNLRAPQGGDPWIQQQDLHSLPEHTLEEIYELTEAIETGDAIEIKDELADLLYHVFLYIEIAEAENLLTLETLCRHIINKHQSRRPAQADWKTKTAEEMNAYWEASKRSKLKPGDSVLSGISTAMPAMSIALKYQKRCAREGFDWPDPFGPLNKIKEELQEVEEAMKHHDVAHLSDELGDLLFSCINLARHLNVNPETALRQSNRRFKDRFQLVEQFTQASGEHLQDLSLEDLETFWQKAKDKV